jgi:acetolactate synthase I/II/III large subunit
MRPVGSEYAGGRILGPRTARLAGLEPARDHADMKLKTTAEHLVSLLAAHGVEYLFLNPGTDTAPVQEAVYALAEAGLPVPTVLLSTFESVSLAAAHAYWKVTGRPQAVFVHVDAGTQNLGAQVHNVMRDRAGVVVIAGRTPYADKGSPGSRDAPIQWQQDVPDQLGIVRGYAKWVQEITRPQMLDRAIGRALQVAASAPAGMAYLTVSRDVLMDPPALQHNQVSGFAVPVPPAPASAEVARIAAALAAAQSPVLVTSRIGRTAEGFAAVQDLADLVGLPVAGRLEGGPVNLPTRHPMNVRGGRPGLAAAISAADVILLVESDVPWLPGTVTLRPDVQVFHLDPDPVKASMPLWSYPVDIAVQADGPAALNAVAAELRRLADEQETVAARLAERVARLRDRPVDLPEVPDSGPLTPVGVMRALSAVIDADDIVVEEAVTNQAAVHEGLERSKPGTLLGPAAPGLGWALGGSLGVKLARPDRRVIAVTGDGAFLFGVPTSALTMAAEWGTPFLTVILDNGGYRASRLPVYALFPEGVSAGRKTALGTRFPKAPDYPALAAACHAHGERVEKAEDLLPALHRALAALDAGQAAVLDCVVEQD